MSKRKMKTKRLKTWVRCIGFGLDMEVAKNKSIEFEIEVFKFSPTISLTASWFTKVDHAGPEFSVNILGNWMSLKLYDHRHWGRKKNQWHSTEDLLPSKDFRKSL